MVSVVVPVYNAEKFLADCIESVLKQTFSDIELILINDGSKDKSLHICAEWAGKDGRIKIVDKPNGGVSTARNCGIEIASGDYITFVDSDDVVKETYVESLINEMKPDIDMVVLGMSYLKPDKTTEPVKHRLKKGVYDSAQLKKTAIDDGTMSGFSFHSPCSILYRKSIILSNEIRFDPNIKFNEDGLFNTQYLFSCKQNVFVDFSNSIYFYRINENSSTGKLDLLSQSYVDAMEQVEAKLLLLADQNDSFNIKSQCQAKYITNALSQFLYAVKTKKGSKSLKSIVKNKRYASGLKQIHYSSLPVKKKLVYLVLAGKRPAFIYMALKLVLVKKN